MKRKLDLSFLDDKDFGEIEGEGPEKYVVGYCMYCNKEIMSGEHYNVDKFQKKLYHKKCLKKKNT